MKIEKANQFDLQKILVLQKHCYQSEANLYQDFSIPPLLQDKASIEAEFTSGTTFLKAMVDDQIVGSVRGKQEGNTCYIGRLIVDPGFQNRRIGSQLMRAIEQVFSDCRRYELFTGHKSEKNLYLYKKLDYQAYKTQVVSEKLTLIFLEKINTT